MTTPAPEIHLYGGDGKVSYLDATGVQKEGRVYPTNKGLLPKNVPSREWWALKTQPPSEGVIAFGGCEADESLDAFWKYTTYGEYSHEWLATDLRCEINGRQARGWIRHASCSTTNNWTNRSRHWDARTGWMWIDIHVMGKWAREIFSGPFAQALESAIRSIGKPMEHPSYVAYAAAMADDPSVEWGCESWKTNPAGGVQNNRYATWRGLTFGTIELHPKGWIAERDYHRFEVKGKQALYMPATLLTSGGDKHVYLGHTAEVTGLADGETRGFSELNPVPNPPRVGTGEWAAFFPSNKEAELFMLRHNIVADRPFLGLHAPEGDRVLLRLERDLAEIAWAEGAAKTPQAAFTIGADYQVETVHKIKYGGMGEYLEIHEGGFKATVFRKGGAVCAHFPWGASTDDMSNGRQKGWIKCPAGLVLSNGLSLRAAGDPTDVAAETATVYDDGRIVVGK